MESASLILRLHMGIFRAAGYCILSLDYKSETPQKISRFLLLWSIILMVAFNAATFNALFCGDDFLFNDDIFGYFNDILKFTIADIALTSAYIGSIWNRYHLCEFWKTYNNLLKKRKNNANSGWRKDLWQNRRFFGIFYAVIASETLAMIIFINFETMSRHLILCWSVFMPFFYAVHLRNMQFILYIEVIRLELVKLKQDLRLLVDYSRLHAYGTRFKGFPEYLRTQIAEKQKIYQQIYELFEHFQNSFGLSIVMILMVIYVRVLVDSYFGYYSHFIGRNKVEIILVLPACLQIPILLISTKNCMDVVKYITLNLHNIISQFNNQTTMVTVQLQNFSLQILHQNICINGIGIIRMDGYMLARVIGSITTYMIFFIQFMPKFAHV